MKQEIWGAIARVAGLAITVGCWVWARDVERGAAFITVTIIIWCVPLLAYPITLCGRKALDHNPSARRAEWTNIVVHYAMMIALGVGIFAAIQSAAKSPGVIIPVPRPVGAVLVIVTGLATTLTVLNLAWRGLGAPFAAKLSSRLATDWMYAWTRNPMLLCTLAWLLAVGIWFRSLWFVVYTLVDLAPAWIFFVKWYEERELEIRFGPGYNEYKARTPLLWPHRPQARALARKAGA